MSRRVSLVGLILVVIVWSAVFLSPVLRLLLRAQAAPQWPIFLEKIGVRDEGFARVLHEHPDDPRVLEAQAELEAMRRQSEGGMRNGNERARDYKIFIYRNKEIIRSYDRLIQRFPQELWLLQNRLRLTMSDGPIMYDGEFSPKDSRHNFNKVTVATTPVELSQALKIAERGARLDPQNSFYDWMRAILLFGLKRDETALRAFQQGARKPRFDDGILRDVQNRIAVKAMQTPLLWEDRVAIIASAELPHYAIMRNANRTVLWRGVLAERAGDHKNALEIYGAQMRLARLMRRGSANFIGVLIGEVMEQGAWGAIARKRSSRHDPGGEALEQNQKDRLDLAARFACYARLHGRNDLASEALRDVRSFEGDKTGNWFEDVWFGTSTGVIQPMFVLQWTNAMLLRALALSTLAWLLLSAMLWRARVRSVLPRVTVLDISCSTLFAMIACAVFFIAAWRSQNSMNVMWWPIGKFSNGDDNVTLVVVSQVMTWLPLSLTMIYCSVVMFWRGRKSTPVVSDDADAETSTEKTASTILIRNALAFAVLIFAWWWWNWLPAQNLILVLTLPGFLLPILIAWISYRLAKQLFAWRPAWDVVYGFAWSRSTLGALLVIGSAAYLICALWALPLRREADARMEDTIARGGVVLMRESIGKK